MSSHPRKKAGGGKPRSSGKTPQTHHESGLSRSVLVQASQVLGEVLRFTYPADAVLSHYFRENREIGQRDRAFIAEVTYAVLRRLRWLRAIAGEQATPRSLILVWLARGEGWPLRKFQGLASEAEQGWLESIKSVEVADDSLGVQADLPDWLIERLLPQLGEAGVLALARALNRSAPLDLRANLLKLDRDALRTALHETGVISQPTPYASQGLRLDGKPALQKHPLFLSGAFEVQDEGSQLLGHLVQPKRGELVVDFCAGAGGKTLQLGAMMRSTGRLYAFDVAEKRLARLKPRVARAGLSNVHPVLIAHERDAKVKRLAGKADRVLVDAPCSGLGTLRRNPDLKWRQTPEAVAEMVAKQQAILASAARMVKPGGRLVYATCSLLAEENDGVVDTFLREHPDFVELSAAEVLAGQGISLDCGTRLALRPDLHDTDGFFAAVLVRQAEPAGA